MEIQENSPEMKVMLHQLPSKSVWNPSHHYLPRFKEYCKLYFRTSWSISQTWVRFFLGIDSYSFPDGSFNASTMLNTSRGWAHFGTVLQCTLNCVFPNHFERTLLLCLEASIVTLIRGTGLAGPFYDSLFCWTLFLCTRYFSFIVIKLFLSNSDCVCYKKDLS